MGIKDMNEQQLREELERTARNMNAVGARVIAYQAMQQLSMDTIDRLLTMVKAKGSISFEELKSIVRSYIAEIEEKMTNLPPLETNDEVDL